MNAHNVPRKLISQEPSDTDLLAGVRLGMAMWHEAETYSHIAPDVDKMIEFAYTMRADPNSFCEVIMHRDTCHGFMVGSLTPLGFADGTFAYDRLLYVKSSLRGSAAARILINSFYAWAQSKGALHVILGVTSGVAIQRTEQFFNKLGFATVGALTIRET